ncbi:hypothetical protein EHI42_23555 [Rhizobium hidalgonense]|uniref:hypothetical protein n=1 Tax=Rhizobium hidalgonense TaxID=1538159 RepID=UPI000FEC3F69|nr:hypothetical protein [Rhizobium hidalgonense]RWX11883.1 hypothetical protein EHI42_23555 [Rhizobium hidalgonense]
MPKFREIKDWAPGYLNVAPQHITIMAACLACGEKREFDRTLVPTEMRQRLISEIEQHLKCAACGAKAGKLRFGSYMEED